MVEPVYLTRILGNTEIIPAVVVWISLETIVKPVTPNSYLVQNDIYFCDVDNLVIFCMMDSNKLYI